MEVKIEIEQLKSSLSHLSDWQTEETQFVPLSGCHDPNYQGHVVLEEAVNKFLSDPKQQVMLLVGHSGAGKSLYTQGLVTRLCQHYDVGSPIPLWISLPNCKNPEEKAIEEVLEKGGYNKFQIEELRTTQRFIFILDAYDEIRCLKNLTITNRLSRWNAKTIITCRHEYLYSLEHYRNLFTPFDGGKPNYMLSTELYIKPFNPEQIEQYVKQYIQTHPQSAWNNWEYYEKALDEIPGIKELIKTPYMLKLAVEALPDIAKRYENIEDQTYKKDLTRAVLYDVFIQQWFERQKIKLKANHTISEDDDIQPEFWNYAKSLAQLMHEHKICQVYYDPDEENVFDSEVEENPFSRFFDANQPRIQLLQTSCLIREMRPKYYAFAHASLLEYFLTRELYDVTQEKVIVVKKEKCDPKKKKDYFNERLICDENQVIQFLADRFDEDSQFKEEMLARLYASKNKSENAIGAANAITILVRAGVPFNGADLSGIQIPYANISGGFFDRADLSKSDLSNCKMFHVWLREVLLEGAQLEGINLGEYPWFKHPKFEGGGFDFREDLQLLVTACGSEIILWNSVTGEQLNTLSGHKDKVNCVQFSPDGTQLVSGSDDKTIGIWNLKRIGEMTALRGHEDEVKCVAFSPNGKQIVSGSGLYGGNSDNSVRIWDISSGKEFAVLQGHEKGVNSVQFSLNGERVVSGSDDKTVRVWEVESRKELIVLRGHKMGVKCVAFSPDGQQVASGSADCTLKIWEVVSGNMIEVLSGILADKKWIHSVAFSSDGELMVSGGRDKTIRVWEAKTWKQIALLQGHTGPVMNVKFSLDGKRVVSGSDEKTVRVWDIASGHFPTRTRGHEKKVQSVQFSSNAKCVASGSLDETVRIWDVDSGKENVLLREHAYINSVAYSPNGKYILSGGKNTTIQVWEVSSRQVIAKLNGHTESINCVAFSSNGEWVASGGGSWGRDNTIRIWEVEGWKFKAVLEGHKKKVTSVAFSVDGKRVVSGSHDLTVRIWKVENGHEIYALQGHESYVECVAFSQNEELVVSGSLDTTVRIWEMVSGKEIVMLRGHEHAVQRVQFCQEDKRVISGSRDMTVRIWDIASAQSIVVLKFDAEVMDFSYYIQGSLVVGFDDGNLEYWQNRGDENNYCWQLRWSTYIDSQALNVERLLVSNEIGLSNQNRRMLEQRGAIVAAKAAISVAPKYPENPLPQKPPIPPRNYKKGVVASVAEVQKLDTLPQLEPVQKPITDEIKNDSTKNKERAHHSLLAKAKWKAAKQSGSPAHHNDNNDLESKNAEQEDKAPGCRIA